MLHYSVSGVLEKEIKNCYLNEVTTITVLVILLELKDYLAELFYNSKFVSTERYHVL